MKYARLLIPLALLVVAVPAFAVCGYCNEAGSCVWSPGQFVRCHYENHLCTTICVEEYAPNCGSGFSAAESFSNDYRIVAVKVEGSKAAAVKREVRAVTPKKSKKT